MTTIFRIYTDEGFVIGSDGRMTDTVTGLVTSDQCQKIYPFGNDKRIAFCFTGWAYLGDTAEDIIRYNFIDHASRAAATVSKGRFPTVNTYLERCAAFMHRGLRDALRFKTIELPQDGPLSGERGTTIASVLVEGYFSRAPFRREVRFWHEKFELGIPEVEELPLDARPLIYGSRIVGEAFANDARFRRYKIPLGHYAERPLLANAIDHAGAFLTSSCGPEAMELDPVVSRNIGGRLQIATITQKEGFNWVPGYEPS